MKLRVALPVLALLLGGCVAGSATPVPPSSVPVEKVHYTCVGWHSAAICKADPPPWPAGAVYTVP